jgi:hypothetical protein
MNKLINKKLPKGKKVLGLRTVDKDRKAYGDFVWAAKGYVEAIDWQPTTKCGHGLHALIKGEGDGTLLASNSDDLWQVVEILESEIIDLKGKGKFPRCNVLYTGKKDIAVKKIQSAYPEAIVVYGQATAGDNGQATAGNYGQATAGYYGQATAGNYGKATAGDNGKATAGDYGILEISVLDGNRKRIVIGYIGEDGLKPNINYKLNIDHIFTEVK